MIFADKLILLRKKAGWSQEELAYQMDVTRQSVSKREGAQSVPELDKMIRLSELFGVSLDYLPKDEIEEAECGASSDDMPPLKLVSMEEANAFLSVKSKTEIEKLINVYNSEVATGNDYLDVIIMEKSLVMNKIDALFSCIADGSGLSFLNEGDIYSLFGNILDNAIEAISLLEKEKWSVSLSVSTVNKFVRIVCKIIAALLRRSARTVCR